MLMHTLFPTSHSGVEGALAREETDRPSRSYSIEDVTGSLDGVLRQSEVSRREVEVEMYVVKMFSLSYGIVCWRGENVNGTCM